MRDDRFQRIPAHRAAGALLCLTLAVLARAQGTGIGALTLTNGACGAAGGQTLGAPPDLPSSLCSSGNATPVTGTGPWSWNCTGLNGGFTNSCSAYAPTGAVPGQCGSSNGVSLSAPPATGLCAAGNPTAVMNSGPWNWACNGLNGGAAVACSAGVAGGPLNGACGSANSTLGGYSTPPQSNLCAAGTASPATLSGGGPWSWSCVGANEGATASCSAQGPTTACISGSVIPIPNPPGPINELGVDGNGSLYAAWVDSSYVTWGISQLSGGVWNLLTHADNGVNGMAVNAAGEIAYIGYDDLSNPLLYFAASPSSPFTDYTASLPTANSLDAVALDNAGNLYIAARVGSGSQGKGVILKATSSGVTTLFGAAAVCGAAVDQLGDGCPATSAKMSGVGAMTVDPHGNLYFGDNWGEVIRRVDAVTGIVTRVAGMIQSSQPWGSGDGGPATNATLGEEGAVAVDSAGNIYLAGAEGTPVRRVDAGTGIINPLSIPGITRPLGLAADSLENVYIGDWSTGQVVELTSAASLAYCTVASPTDGACGPANGQSLLSAPTSATNLCSAGTPWAVLGSGPWSWYCMGQNSGANALCSASQATLQSQTINFQALAAQTFGAAPFSLAASASSGLPVSFASLTTAVCTVNASTVTLVGAGTCTIQATQTGNSTYAAATPVNQSFQVQISQTIAFGPLSDLPLATSPFTVSATASSGLAVNFQSLTTAVCTVAGSTVTLAGSGTCTIQATQPGNTIYTAAAAVNQSFLVGQPGQSSQAITFGALADQPLNAAPFTVSATASSGLAVTFYSATSTICTVSGATVTLVASGTCTIEAFQAGNSQWMAAAPAYRSFQVTKQGQTISFGTLADQTIAALPFYVSATASSGLTVSFASLTQAVCTVSSTTVTLVAVGTCTIQASQAGNATYAAATAVSQSFQVTPLLSQTITFGALADKPYGSPVFNVSATASSGLTVGFSSLTPVVCTMTNTSVYVAAVGTCTIQATQTGNSTYAAAAPVNQSFNVIKASQTITFNPIADQTYPEAGFAPVATASSGLTVTFTSLTTSVCTVSNSPVGITLVGVGTCTIQASQAGNSNYQAAASVNVSFNVTQNFVTITANDQTAIYGGVMPVLTYTVNPNVTLDTAPICNSAKNVNSPVGAYPGAITCSGAAKAGYTINYVAGQFTVTPASLTITANDQTVVYGGTMPALTYTVNPNLPLDTPPSCSSTQNAGSPVGSYPGAISCSGAAKANYTISYIAGKLTVTAASLTITANDQAVVSGGTMPALTYTVNPNLPLDTPPSCSSTQNAGSPVGSYPGAIACSGAAKANYTIGYVAGKLTVNVNPAIPVVINDNETIHVTDTLAWADSADNETIHVTDTVALAVGYATATVGHSIVVTASASSQTVPLKATVSSTAGAPTAGTVSFTLLGQTVTSGLTNGAATLTFTIPAGTAAGMYPIQMVYSGATGYLGSSDNTQTLTINPGAPALSVTSKTLTRDKGAIALGLTIGNSGIGPAQAVQLTAVTIGATSTTTSPLPTLGTIAPGGSASTGVVFPDTVGSSGSAAVLTISGSYTGGTFTIVSRITLP